MLHVCPKNGHAIVSPRSDTSRVYCTMRTVIYTWSIDRSSIVRRREREREGQVRQKGQLSPVYMHAHRNRSGNWPVITDQEQSWPANSNKIAL